MKRKIGWNACRWLSVLLLAAVLCMNLSACSFSLESTMKKLKAYINGEEIAAPPQDFVESREGKDFRYDVYTDYVVLTEYIGESADVVVPAKLDGLPVRKIASLTFYDGVKIESVQLPSGLTELDENAFYYCTSLTSVIVPDTVQTIGDKCFSWCSALETAVLPSGLKALPAYCFNQCTSLTSVTLPKALNSVGTRAFSGCEALERLTLSDATVSVGNYAFRGCTSLRYIGLSGICKLGDGVFNDCSETLTVITKANSACWTACEQLGLVLAEEMPADVQLETSDVEA